MKWKMYFLFVTFIRTRRLFAHDEVLNSYFLVDTGADISVTSAGREDRNKVNKFKLYAANGTSISTYGETVLD